VMKGDQEIKAMRAAGPPRQYHATLPLAKLITELNKHPRVRYVRVQRSNDSLIVKGDSAVAS